MRWSARSPWSGAYLTIGATFLLGVAVAIIAGLRATNDRDVWTEVSKAGVSIALITVAGAFASIAVKRVDERRAREAGLRRILHVVLGAYNEAKAARRNLRALGIANHDDRRRLHDEQIRELRIVLVQLNNAQLALEASAREIPHSGLFQDWPVAVSHLRCAEDFINKSAIKTWECVGAQLWPGREVSLADLDGLRMFAGHKRDGGKFERCVSTPLDRLIEQINEELGAEAASSHPQAQPLMGSPCVGCDATE